LFDQSDIDGVARVLESHLVGPGAKAKELERHFARLLGFEHAVSTSTATNAFWLLARALDLDGSTEVIVPNIHFYGVTNALRLLDVPYRIADVGPGVPNISPEAMAACLTTRTRAVVALDYGGWPADVPGMRRALAAAGRSDVLLIADAANSLLTQVAGKYWAHGYDHAFLSFDMNKIVVTGDGGMVLTDDATVSERVRRLAFHGIEGEGLTGFERARRGAGGGPMWWEERIGEPGLNLLMNDIAASLGLTQLAKAEGFLAKRQAVRDVYLERLAPLAEAGTVELPPTSPSVSGDLYMFWIKLADRATRDALARSLLEQGVYTSVKYQPLDASAGTPNAHDFWARALCLPLHQNLEPVFADYVMSQVVEFLGTASRPLEARSTGSRAPDERGDVDHSRPGEFRLGRHRHRRVARRRRGASGLERPRRPWSGRPASRWGRDRRDRRLQAVLRAPLLRLHRPSDRRAARALYRLPLGRLQRLGGAFEGSRIAKRCRWPRMYSVPSARAGVARIASPIEFVANSSKLGPARTT
jgi:aminotransferase